MEKAGHKLSYWSLYWLLLANQYLFSDFLHRHGGGCSVDTTERERERTPSVSTMSEGTQGSCWDTSGCLVGTSEATHSSRSNMIIDPPVSEHLSWSYLPFHSDLLICSDFFLLPPNPLPPFSTSVVLIQSCSNFACLLKPHIKVQELFRVHVFSCRVVRKGTGEIRTWCVSGTRRGRWLLVASPSLPFK